MTAGVYLITHTPTGRFYVGSSKHCERRFIEHASKLSLGKHHCRALQRHWSKYGVDAFEMRVIASCMTQEDALVIEQIWLDEHHGSRQCLNGSSRAWMPILAPEVQARAAATRLTSAVYLAARRKVCVERNACPELQRKVKESFRNSAVFKAAAKKNGQRLQDPVVKAKNRLALQASVAQKNAARAQAAALNASPQVQAKLRAKLWKQVIATCIVTGAERAFASQSEAARAFGVYPSSVSEASRDPTKTVRGHRWRIAINSEVETVP